MEKENMTIHTPLSERRRPLTPEEHQYVEQYLVPKWRRKHLLRQFRTQLDEFFESSEEKWDAQISEPLDAWSVFRSLYWRLQRRGLENKTEIKIVGGKIVSICKL